MAMEGVDRVVAVSATQPQPLDVLWKAITELFRQGQPSDEQMREICGVASLAITVTTRPERYGFPMDAAGDFPGAVENAAQCSALYGYWLGYNQGRQTTNARA